MEGRSGVGWAGRRIEAKKAQVRHRCASVARGACSRERVGPRCSSSSLALSQGASQAPPQGTTTPRVPPRAPSGLALGCPRPNASRRALKGEGE